VIGLLRRLFKPRVRRKEQNRVANLRAVRTNQRSQLPGFAYDYGDYDTNKRNSEAIRKQYEAKQERRAQPQKEDG
jgi:hypothetical protein